MKRQRPDMNFAVKDVTDMSGFAQDQEYTVALDKGKQEVCQSEGAVPTYLVIVSRLYRNIGCHVHWG